MKTPFLASMLVALLTVAGCPSGPQLPPYDSQQAEETLVAALDAWKQGRVAELAKRNPPLRFEDEDQRNGFRLAEYHIEQPELPLRPFRDVRVRLVLRDSRGRDREKTVAYQVTLAPRLAVLRND